MELSFAALLTWLEAGASDLLITASDTTIVREFSEQTRLVISYSHPLEANTATYAFETRFRPARCRSAVFFVADIAATPASDHYRSVLTSTDMCVAM